MAKQSTTGTTGTTTGDLDEGRFQTGTPATGTTTGTRGTTGLGTAGAAQGGAQIVGGEESRGFHDGPGPQIMAADTLEDNDVVNAAGEDLGEIEHIMLDVQRGRIAYAVLSMGGFLGMGEKLFAVPWSALKLDADNKCFILDVDKQTLQNAPGFDKDNWPAMADKTFCQSVYSHYGQRPYWEV